MEKQDNHTIFFIYKCKVIVKFYFYNQLSLEAGYKRAMKKYFSIIRNRNKTAEVKSLTIIS